MQTRKIEKMVLLFIVVAASGCVTSRIEQSREAATGIGAEEAMVILIRASYSEHQTEESFTECIEDNLSRGSSPIQLISESEFKDQMYPWFEATTAPTSTNDLGRLFCAAWCTGSD